MKELALDNNLLLLSFFAGAYFAVLLIILKYLRNSDKIKKILKFIADFTFIFNVIMVTYIVSIPLTYGRVRLLQVLLEGFFMLIVYFALEVPLCLVLSLPQKIKKLLIKITKGKVLNKQ